jgi:hypothetical protein
VRYLDQQSGGITPSEQIGSLFWSRDIEQTLHTSQRAQNVDSLLRVHGSLGVDLVDEPASDALEHLGRRDRRRR